MMILLETRLHLYDMSSMNRELVEKRLNSIEDARNSMLASLMDEIGTMAYNKITKSSVLRALWLFIQHYEWLSPAVIAIQVLLQQLEELLTPGQQEVFPTLVHRFMDLPEWPLHP